MGQRIMYNVARLRQISVASLMILASCDQSPAVVDTTIDSTKPVSQSNAVNDQLSDKGTTTAEGELIDGVNTARPSITKTWLIGTWGPAEYNPKNDPSSSCDTDVLIVFNSDGSFADGGSEGRFSTDGKTIRYYDRRTLPDIAADASEPFSPEALSELNAKVTAEDINTFSEDGEQWRRCRSE